MTVELYVVRDILNGFGQLMCETSEAVAKRNFSFAISNNDVMGFTPKDFDLYKVGFYDTTTGVIKPSAVPELVCRGTDVYLGGD